MSRRIPMGCVVLLSFAIYLTGVACPARCCEPGQPPGGRVGRLPCSANSSASGGAQRDRSAFRHLVSTETSTYHPDFNPWLTADESELFYIVRDDRIGPPHPGYQGEWDIYVSQWDPITRTWGPGTNLGPNVNTTGSERRPSTTATGDTLFFCRAQHTFVSLRSGGVYGLPVMLFPGRDPAISGDGQQLYFVRDNNIWVADRAESLYTWTNLQELGPPVNTGFCENRPFVTADGGKLFFSDFGHNRPGGYGGDDLWVSNWTGSAWSEPVNIGPPVNTDMWTCTACLTRDGKRLYVGGESFEGGHGDEDVWRTRSVGTGRTAGEFRSRRGPTSCGWRWREERCFRRSPASGGADDWGRMR